MRLKRLELQGFKSFLDRTILTFDPGITGVVGPNGCGKSNIVDAIQWVMGEQSAKHLRGESMTDVIFNGSDTKAATSMAEVSLILDRQGVALSPTFSAFDKADEISITRRVYRDGTGEYLINKTICRLKDIHELFMDTGVGKRAYSIIEQGQIDRMINVKPEERRHLFEEVAGITKYKAKRKEAEKKLEATRQNLLRLADIITELEKQIRSLKIQATRAKKYKELKVELEAVDLYLLGRNLFQHKKTIDELTERRDKLVAERSESDASYAQTDAELTELEVLRIDQEKLYQSLSDKERDLSLQIQRLESQYGLFEERRKHLAESHEANQNEEKEVSDTLQSLSAEVDKEQEELGQVQASLTALEDSTRDAETRLKDAQEEKNRTQHRREGLQDKKTQNSHKALTLQNQKQHAEQRAVDLQNHRGEITQKMNEVLATMGGHKENLRSVDKKIENCAERSQAAEQDVSNIHSECQEVSTKLSNLEETLYEARENFHQQNSRLGSLKELQENLEGYSPTARELLVKLEGHDSVQAVPLAEVLQPEAEIEDHLEMLLGLDMNTLLVKSTQEAENLAKLITQRGLERVRILATEELSGSSQNTVSLSDATPILSKIRVKPGYEGAAQWWLGNTYLCANEESLFNYRKAHSQNVFVTLDTKTVAEVDRSLVSGALPTKTGVFARRREIEELEIACKGLDEDLKRQDTERENLLQHLQSQEKLHLELKDKLSSLHIESVEYRKEREKVQLEIARTERDYNSLSHEVQRNSDQLQETQNLMERIDNEMLQLREEEDRILSELTELETLIKTLTQDLENFTHQINEKRIEKSRQAERVNGLEYKLGKLKVEIEELTDRREDLKEKQERDEKELAAIDENKADTKIQEQKVTEEKQATVVQLSDTKNAFNDTCNRLQHLREVKTELQKKRETVLIEIQEIELKVTHEQSNYEHLCSISNERYQTAPTPLDESVQIDLEKAPLFVSQLSVDWGTLSETERKALLEEHLKTMREKISRYGEVNLTAIQEFDEIQKRYDFLMEQKTDLEKSITILEDAIKKIDETTHSRFAETFEAVNHKFKEIFPILFNGGKAELTMTHSEGQMDSGVDIMVQPPGKRLQTIGLLSGGEKALTAVSLVLAIFARKPSPFCLLDEVDAPLDDANVSRFNTVVRKMAEKTQFILITHNKKTMEIAEALYGVTMERAGVSKMTSVRLN